MRRSALTAAILLTTLTIAGCQGKIVKVESKQDQLKELQEKYNTVLAASLADCPMDASMNTPQTPKCKQESAKLDSMQEQIKVLSSQVATE